MTATSRYRTHQDSDSAALALTVSLQLCCRRMAMSRVHRGLRRLGRLPVAPLSTFSKIPMGPPDPIFGLTDAFNKVSIGLPVSYSDNTFHVDKKGAI
jgi:hypothetical protein